MAVALVNGIDAADNVSEVASFSKNETRRCIRRSNIVALRVPNATD